MTTQLLEIGTGILARVPEIFRQQFGTDTPALSVSDPRTHAAAGRRVAEALREAGVPLEPGLLLTDPHLHAEWRFVEAVEGALTNSRAIPVAVGSGTINDLVKLAAHRTGRQYLAVATAASMDGYTAFGASITYRGSKQTFDCPAPVAVVADLEVLCAAPPELSAAGYADLLAKVPAGADWILADELEIEPIDPTAWAMVQHPLREALADPAGVARGEVDAVAALTRGLMQGGFAMQHTRTSRPASGAEHQFSHLWDMQGHTHQGRAPAHGFKVGIATLAVTQLYEELLQFPMERLDPEARAAAWPAWPEVERDLEARFPEPAIRQKALEETAAKHVDPGALRDHLRRLRDRWPALRDRLRQQLLPPSELEAMLRAVGAPTAPEEIGISPERLSASFLLAYHLRRRFTVLDLARWLGILSGA